MPYHLPFPHPIAFNLIPHVDQFREDGYTKEELKMRNESRKILSLPKPQSFLHLCSGALYTVPTRYQLMQNLVTV